MQSMEVHGGGLVGGGLCEVPLRGGTEVSAVLLERAEVDLEDMTWSVEGKAGGATEVSLGCCWYLLDPCL